MRNGLAIVALIWAIALSVTSLIMPPMGVIDSSVLILIAQIIVFIATLIGIALPQTFSKILKNDSKS